MGRELLTPWVWAIPGLLLQVQDNVWQQDFVLLSAAHGGKASQPAPPCSKASAS